ncbi:hypothetical protein VTJ04DRAFT_8014 [Mycothermus thermophilus]|uniref:uncharacterized protein n=1 Tax=Humicola insolens TaxID=85995 RepID=UPI0037428108
MSLHHPNPQPQQQLPTPPTQPALAPQTCNDDTLPKISSMTQPNHAGLSPALVETVAGLSAGTIATLIVHPLDIVKTRMHVYRTSHTSPLLRSSTSSPTALSLLRALLQSDRPLASLYRGLTPNLLGNATSWASFFFFKSRFERAIILVRGGGNITSPTTTGTAKNIKTSHGDNNSNNKVLTPSDFFLSSLLAGAATQLLTNPIWVLKTRMLASDAAAHGAYPSLLSGAKLLWQQEGLRGFYRGLGVGMLAVSHGAVQFAVYDPLRRIFITRDGKSAASAGGGSGTAKEGGRGRGGLSNEATLLLSTVSKLVAGVATYPLQVLRSRLQHHDADAQFGRHAREVVARLWREEGPRGFYRGLVPHVVRVLPATWVTFLVYENTRFYLPRWWGVGRQEEEGEGGRVRV